MPTRSDSTSTEKKSPKKKTDTETAAPKAATSPKTTKPKSLKSKESIEKTPKSSAKPKTQAAKTPEKPGAAAKKPKAAPSDKPKKESPQKKITTTKTPSTSEKKGHPAKEEGDPSERIGIVKDFRFMKPNQVYVVFQNYPGSLGELIGRKIEWYNDAGARIRGRIIGQHGRGSVLRARFNKNLPCQAIGSRIRLV